ncbi:ArsR/SmtB family transcription factor [Lacticaseibacillus yichunensis]|uniref:ArsR/SmtB family transcription factor n=1 Tax=Lacticaseibacillus yichunensis TaxID=2486015 RepID=A0ABW4CMH2_9LACO|nr:metalloregulator ArsR/SmtB family transcription factor [Lacticaseibacillus yichunensis]
MAKYDPAQCRALIRDNVDIDFFRVICDPVRSELLVYLAGAGELTIGQIAEEFPRDRSVISRHLEMMYRLGAITRRKDGREVYYKVANETIINKFSEAARNMKALLG